VAIHSVHRCASRRDTPAFFFFCHANHRPLPSFPTRRSSDLCGSRGASPASHASSHSRRQALYFSNACASSPDSDQALSGSGAPRSEEHTSELQSRENLVCRLLLEKKKKDMAATDSSR